MDPWHPQNEQFNPLAYQRGNDTSRLHQLAIRQLGGPMYGGMIGNANNQAFEEYMEALRRAYGASPPREVPPMLSPQQWSQYDLPQPSWEPLGGVNMGHITGGLDRMAGSGGTHGSNESVMKALYRSMGR